MVPKCTNTCVKPRILCVKPGYLSKPDQNFGFGYVRYLYIYLSLYLSVCLSVYLSIYLSMCPCIYLSVSPSMSLAVPLTIYLSVRLSIYLFIYRSVCPSIYVSIYVSIYLSTYLCVYLSVYLSIDLSIYLSTYLSISLSIYLSVYLSISLCIDLCIYLSICLSIYLSIYLSISRSIVVVVVVVVVGVVVVAVAVVVEVRVVELVKLVKLVKLVQLISFYFFDIFTSKKPQNPQFFTLLTSKCASRHNGVHFFDIWTSKSGPRPSVFNTFDLEMCFAPQRRALFRHLNFQKWSDAEVFCTFWLGNVLRATTACTFSTSQLPKVVRRWGVLYILTWKCASRHNGVHFFDISTSKSGPTLRCFVHFDLEMCFAPQRRALFRHLNFQKWSDAEVFCTFWLGNVLRATTACTFSTSQLPKVVRTPGVLYILTWKCASRHNGVQFFIAPVASWLRTRRFSEPTFRPSWATNHWKNTVFRDFPTFSRICIFCPLTLSLLIFSLLIFLFSVPLPCSAFHLSILSEVWLLNFLRWFCVTGAALCMTWHHFFVAGAIL